MRSITHKTTENSKAKRRRSCWLYVTNEWTRIGGLPPLRNATLLRAIGKRRELPRHDVGSVWSALALKSFEAIRVTIGSTQTHARDILYEKTSHQRVKHEDYVWRAHIHWQLTITSHN